MHFTQEDDGYKAWFVLVEGKGTLITGAVAGDFTATVVDPDDDASTSPTVSESTEKPGLYTFLIPTAFLTTNGTGNYGVVVEVNKTTSPKIDDVISATLRSYDTDLGNVLGATVNGALLSAVITQIQKLLEADQSYDKGAELLHFYDRGTTTDLIPAKTIAGTSQTQDASATE